VQARGIDKNHLGCIRGEDAKLAFARGLRLGGDAGDGLPERTLVSVLLPTLGLPAMAIKPDLNGEDWSLIRLPFEMLRVVHSR